MFVRDIPIRGINNGKTDKELKHKIKEYNEDRTKYTVKMESASFRNYAGPADGEGVGRLTKS